MTSEDNTDLSWWKWPSPEAAYGQKTHHILCFSEHVCWGLDHFEYLMGYPPWLLLSTFVFLENGPKLSVVTDQAKVISRRGGNATLPCRFQRDPAAGPNPKLRIKWTKLTADYLKEVDVFVAMGYHKRSYGRFHGRVHLQGDGDSDASLVINDITLEDYGRYKCEVIDGLEDGTVVISLDLQGQHLLFVALCWR